MVHGAVMLPLLPGLGNLLPADLECHVVLRWSRTCYLQ
jgi:hypothetical protein